MDPQRPQQLPPGPASSGGKTPARTLLQVAGMMTVDPAVLGGAVAGLVTLQLTSLGILLAVLRFFYRRLDRRFAEVRTDIDRRFSEVRTDIDRRFAEARDDHRRLEEKLDEHGREVARLQGIVERTYEPQRFTVGMPGKPPAVGSP